MLMDALGRPPAGGSTTAVPAGLHSLTGAERLLWEASERALRHPKDRVVVVLHLSRLAPPAPRPHHIRVARVLLQDCASRHAGQVFAMWNQDMVLLCQQPGRSGVPGTGTGPQRPEAACPDQLPATLARLFSADAPNASGLVSLWRLDQDAPAMLAYLSARAAGPQRAEAVEDVPDDLLSLTVLQSILAKAPLADLIVQQTGMLLSADRSRCMADRLTPAFRELQVSFAALNLRSMAAHATADPFLLCHLTSGLDGRMIQLLAEDLAQGGLLTRSAVQAGLAIQLDLGLEAILSPAFARLSNQAAKAGIRFGASVSLMQACADLDLMEHARRVLQLTGGELVLARVNPAALGIVVPAALQPDLLKLVWSPTLLHAGLHEPEHEGLAAALAGLDPARIVLAEVDGSAALAWGQAHGIAMFQGAFLDQIQAATRMARCHSAAACTVRQCSARGSAAGRLGRAGCGNPALLEQCFTDAG